MQCSSKQQEAVVARAPSKMSANSHSVCYLLTEVEMSREITVAASWLHGCCVRPSRLLSGRSPALTHTHTLCTACMLVKTLIDCLVRCTPLKPAVPQFFSVHEPEVRQCSAERCECVCVWLFAYATSICTKWIVVVEWLPDWVSQCV